MRLNGRIILTVFLASICPHDLRGLSLLQRLGDGHVRLSSPQFSKDAAQTKFANCHWFKQQLCECPSKPFPMLVRRGQGNDLHPSREKDSGTFLVALHWQFGTLKVQLLTKYRSIAPQFIKHTAFEAPILQVVE